MIKGGFVFTGARRALYRYPRRNPSFNIDQEDQDAQRGAPHFLHSAVYVTRAELKKP